MSELERETVDIIMPVYKEEISIFSQALASILNQTYKNIHIIIGFDDCKNFNVIDYVRQCRDKRITFYVNENNLGIVKNLNKALKMCTSKYIARMDADDISHLNRIEKQLEFIQLHNADLVGTAINILSNKHDIIKKKFYPTDRETIQKMLKINSCCPHPTWLATKSLYEDIGGYRDVPTCEDYDFLIRCIIMKKKILNVDEILLDYRINDNGISQKNKSYQ